MTEFPDNNFNRANAQDQNLPPPSYMPGAYQQQMPNTHGNQMPPMMMGGPMNQNQRPPQRAPQYLQQQIITRPSNQIPRQQINMAAQPGNMQPGVASVILPTAGAYTAPTAYSQMDLYGNAGRAQVGFPMVFHQQNPTVQYIHPSSQPQYQIQAQQPPPRPQYQQATYATINGTTMQQQQQPLPTPHVQKEKQRKVIKITDEQGNDRSDILNPTKNHPRDATNGSQDGRPDVIAQFARQVAELAQTPNGDGETQQVSRPITIESPEEHLAKQQSQIEDPGHMPMINQARNQENTPVLAPQVNVSVSHAIQILPPAVEETMSTQESVTQPEAEEEPEATPVESEESLMEAQPEKYAEKESVAAESSFEVTAALESVTEKDITALPVGEVIPMQEKRLEVTVIEDDTISTPPDTESQNNNFKPEVVEKEAEQEEIVAEKQMSVEVDKINGDNGVESVAVVEELSTAVEAEPQPEPVLENKAEQETPQEPEAQMTVEAQDVERSATEEVAVEQKESEIKPTEESVAEVKPETVDPVDDKAEDNGDAESEPQCVEGETPTDSAIEKAKKMGYVYDKDQWSPFNTEGSKTYSRSFLLQFAAVETEKPEDLPKFPELLTNTPNNVNHRAPQGRSFDFTPNFLHHQGPGRGYQNSGGRPKNSSRSKDYPQQKKIILIQEEVKLHTSEKAWKVKEKDAAPEAADSLEVLLSDARSILNKLTPEKFDKLKDQFLKLNFRDEERLKAVVDLLFNMAISEPSVCVSIAKLCAIMSEEQMECGSFKTLLIANCRIMYTTKHEDREAQIRAEMKEKIEKASSDGERDILEEKMEIEIGLIKKRYMGNMKFIGELFLLGIVSPNTVGSCLTQLLRSGEEEKLESMCHLLNVVGIQLENLNPSNLGGIIQGMKDILKQKNVTISSRIRFMIQEVIETRGRKWKGRRKKEGPKKIDEVHEDVKIEEINKQVQSQMIKNQWRSNEQQRKPVPSRPVKSNLLDPTKTKFSKMEDQICLGPKRSWAHGSSGGSGRGQQSASQEKQTSNRFSYLASKEPSGRPSGAGYREQESRGAWGGNSPYRGQRGSGMGQSMEHDKESAIAATRNFMGGRQTPSGSRNASRESSRSRGPSARPSVESEPKGEAKPPQPIKPEIGTERYEKTQKKCIAIVQEFISVANVEEALLCVKELDPTFPVYMFVLHTLSYIVEHSDKDRECGVVLFKNLLKAGLLKPEHFYRGLSEFFVDNEDLDIDIPRLWEHVGRLIAALVADRSIPLNNQLVMRCFAPLLKSKRVSGKLMAETIKALRQFLNEQKTFDLWKASNLNWSDFLSEKSDVDEFVQRYDLQFTQSTAFSVDAFSSQLMEMLQSSGSTPQKSVEMINKCVPEENRNQPQFIRALVTGICKHAISNAPGTVKVELSVIENFCDLLNRYIDHDASLELQALFALQTLAYSYSHPAGFLQSLFEKLSEGDVISDEAFLQWKDDTTEKVGKGVATMSVERFLITLQEGTDE